MALVSLETLTIPESLVSSVKALLPESHRVVLVATHTHCAPDSQMLNDRMTFKVPGIATFNRRVLNWYARRIVEGIEAAQESQPISTGYLGIRQSIVAANHVRRQGAAPDQTATWISLGKRPLLTIYAAHGTIYGADRLLTSGDWLGAVAKESGGLVLPGAIGDVAPDLIGADPVENIQNIVEKLSAGRAMAEVVGLSLDQADWGFVEEKIELSVPTPHPEFATAYGAAKPFDQVLVSRFAPVSANISLVSIGGALLIGVPGEPTSELGRKLKAAASAAGFPHSVVVSHCNGWIGYILEPEDYDRGGYEATLSFHGRETSIRVVEALDRGLVKMRLDANARSKRGFSDRRART